MVPSFWADMVPNPLGGGLCPALGGPSGQVREACLPPHLIWDLVGCVAGRRLRHAINNLVAWDPLVGRDPNDAGLVAPGHHPVCNLYDSPGPLLPRPH